MSRDILKVDSVPSEAKKALQAAALKLYGKANVSLMVRTLIAQHLKLQKQINAPVEDQVKKRLELRLPLSVYDALGDKANTRLSDRNDYIKSLIYQDLGQPQLLVDEIEVLRSSNYHMAKIGTNLNQIAKAFNLLVQMGGQDKLPELGKKMLSLRREIRGHTNKVLRVLNARAAILKK